MVGNGIIWPMGIKNMTVHRLMNFIPGWGAGVGGRGSTEVIVRTGF